MSGRALVGNKVGKRMGKLLVESVIDFSVPCGAISVVSADIGRMVLS